MAFSISNYKDSAKSPAATLSGFLGLGASVATLLPRCRGGHRTGVAAYGQGPACQHQAPALSLTDSWGFPKSPVLQGLTHHEHWMPKENQ